MVAEPHLLPETYQDQPQAAPRRPAHARLRRGSTQLIGVALVAFAAVLRLIGIGSSYDLFEDEVDYVDLGKSMSHGSFPPVFHSNIPSAGPGGPFLLHPPMSFLVSGIWQAITWSGGTYFQLVDDVRVLNALIAAGCAGLLYLLGRRLGTSRSTGVVAALLFALEPYVLRQNGRVLIETTTLAFVLLGFALILRVYQGRAAHPALTAVAGGLVGGLAIVCKDMAILMVELPLVAGVIFGAGASKRRWSAVAAACGLVPYAVYLGALAWVGSLEPFWLQETSGLRRFFGQQKSTGFSRQGSPSLSHTILNQLSSFGTTYLVIIVGLLAGLYLLIVHRRRADHRLLVMVVVGGGLTVFYALFFGTIEEQFLYLLLVPTLLVLVVGAQTFIARQRRNPLAWRRVAAACLAAVLAWNAVVWVRVHTHPDNGEQRIATWFQRHDPHPGIIANDTNVTALALHRVGYATVIMPRAADAAREHIRYLTVLPVETAGSYGELTIQREQFFLRTGHRVLSFHEATYGDVMIIETNDPSVW